MSRQISSAHSASGGKGQEIADTLNAEQLAAGGEGGGGEPAAASADGVGERNSSSDGMKVAVQVAVGNLVSGRCEETVVLVLNNRFGV